MFKGEGDAEEAPLRTFWNGTKWKTWTRGQPTHCLTSGSVGVTEEWGQEKRGRED